MLPYLRWQIKTLNLIVLTVSLLLLFFNIMVVRFSVDVQGSVINYRGGGATKWENFGSKTFRVPPF